MKTFVLIFKSSRISASWLRSGRYTRLICLSISDGLFVGRNFVAHRNKYFFGSNLVICSKLDRIWHYTCDTSTFFIHLSSIHHLKVDDDPGLTNFSHTHSNFSYHEISTSKFRGQLIWPTELVTEVIRILTDSRSTLPFKILMYLY